MSEQAITAYDVWLIAANRVYGAVPYEVLADWLQQGRVAPTDKVRPAGKGEWTEVAQSPMLATFLPHAEAQDSEDTAEALETVALDLPIPRRHEDEDDDVDMIPLIDISLVLLIFFMMTASVAVSGADVDTPTTYHGVEISAGTEVVWIGVDRGQDGSPVYSIGVGNAPAEDGDRNLNLPQVLSRVDARLANGGFPVRIAGHRSLPFRAIQSLTAEIEKRRGPGKISEIKAEVSEKSS